MKTTPLALLLTSLVALDACRGATTEVATDLPFVSATRSCAPTDGPAVSITWSARPATGGGVDGSYVQVHLWSGVGALEGRRFRLATGSADGFGRAVGADGMTAGDVSGAVRVERVAADSSMSGTIDVTLPDGARFARAFDAPWVPSEMRCG
jgi:hypothetical protein